MPRATPDILNTTVGIQNLPKDSVVFDVIDSKYFERESTDDAGNTRTLFGIQFTCKVAKSETGLDIVGRNSYPQFYMHDTKAYPMLKSFVMACLGYGVKDEKTFNEKYGDGELWVVDAAAMGSIYDLVKGKKVSADVDVKVTKNRKTGEDMEQQTYRWRPIL